MEAFGKEMEAKFGPNSRFAEKVKKDPEAAAKSQARGSLRLSSAARSERGEAKSRTAKSNFDHERCIQELEAEFNKLVAEIKALKSDRQSRDDD